jgi:hypothetical protein
VESVELLGSLGSSVRLVEDDRGDSTAGAVLVVCEHNPSNRTCGLGKVFLYVETISISSYQFDEVMILKCRKRLAAQTRTSEGEKTSASASKHQPKVCSIPVFKILYTASNTRIPSNGQHIPANNTKHLKWRSTNEDMLNIHFIHNSVKRSKENIFHVATIDVDSSK